MQHPIYIRNHINSLEIVEESNQILLGYDTGVIASVKIDDLKSLEQSSINQIAADFYTFDHDS